MDISEDIKKLSLFQESRIHIDPRARLDQVKRLKLKPDPSAVPAIHSGSRMLVMSGERFSLVSYRTGLIEESLYLNKKEAWLDEFSRVQKTERMTGQTILSGNAGYKNYYHWVYQVWMALVYLRANVPNFYDCRVLGPRLNEWRREFIDMLGITNYVEAKRNCAFLLDDAIHSNVSFGSLVYSPDASVIRLVDDVVRDVEPMPEIEGIYISRKDTLRRGVENEDELIARLEALGLKSLSLSEFTVKQQIRFFRSASVIVAPHGAGLDNLMFARTGAQVIELIPDDYVNACFYAICFARGLDYRAVICPSSNGVGSYHRSTMTVDVGLVEQLVKGTVSATTPSGGESRPVGLR